MKEKSSDRITYDILQLQNLIKRDPPSYHEEFYQQYAHYKSYLDIFKTNPAEYNDKLADLVSFLAQVSSYYTEDLKNFPDEIIKMLREYSSVIDSGMRMCFCKALILMRNRNILKPVDLIKLSFELFRCKDKLLRQYMHIYIVSDLKKLNAKHKNVKVNTTLQNFMFKMLTDKNTTAAKMSLDIMIELYRRHIWKDVKTVNGIATACFSKTNKILVAAHQFFLGVDEEDEINSDSEDDDKPTVREVIAANKVNKKTRKRMRTLKRTKLLLNKQNKKKRKENFDFSALHLLNDPQGMAEKLLKNLQTMNERFEIKLLIMNLISRLVGVHELILLNFYPLLLKYLRPHQREVTKVLMFAAQSAHEAVPPDIIEPVLRAIAQNFITERNSSETITVGINSIKEICIRCPLAMDQDLLQDLVEYKSYRNKNVAMSAHSLIQLFRKISPHMLQRKYRAKPTEATAELKTLEYGAVNAKSYISGAEVLTVNPANNETNDTDAEDSDGSWVNVSHSEDEMLENDNIDKLVQNTTDKQCFELNMQNDINVHAKRVMTASEEDVSLLQNSTEKAITISQTRILSQEEFHKVKVAQIALKLQTTKGKKRKAIDETDALENQRSELVSLRDIEKLHKRIKQDKESRLSTIREGREDREKFGQKKKKNPQAGKTQKEHNRKKAFMMIKPKVRGKIKRSFKDKQIALRDALLKRKKKK